MNNHYNILFYNALLPLWVQQAYRDDTLLYGSLYASRITGPVLSSRGYSTMSTRWFSPHHQRAHYVGQRRALASATSALNVEKSTRPS